MIVFWLVSAVTIVGQETRKQTPKRTRTASSIGDNSAKMCSFLIPYAAAAFSRAENTYTTSQTPLMNRVCDDDDDEDEICWFMPQPVCIEFHELATPNAITRVFLVWGRFIIIVVPKNERPSDAPFSHCAFVFDKICQLKLHRPHRTNTCSEQSNGCMGMAAANASLKHKNHFIIQELMRLPLIEQKQSHFKWKRKISSFLFSHFLLCSALAALPAQTETHSCKCLFSRMWKTTRRRRIYRNM